MVMRAVIVAREAGADAGAIKGRAICRMQGFYSA